MGAFVNFILDGLILVFLGVTIFYVTRVMHFFKNFRSERHHIETLLSQLSITIDKAEAATASMKNSAQQSESELREIMSESKFLADELRFMTESGNSLAQRLENLAGRNRELLGGRDVASSIDIPNGSQLSRSVDQKRKVQTRRKPRERDAFHLDDVSDDDWNALDIDDEADFQAFAYIEDEDTLSQKENKKLSAKERVFSIFDRDYATQRQSFSDNKRALVEDESQFYSRAEQDLYEALQKRKSVRENI